MWSRSKVNSRRELLLSKYDDLLRYVQSIDLHDIDARDVVQETFVEAYKNIDKLRDETKVFSWLCTIARRKANHQLSETKYGKYALVEDYVIEQLTADETYDDEIFARSVEKFTDEYILECLNKLLPLEKAVIELFYGKDMELNSIAKMLEISYNYTKNIKLRGLKKLAKIFANEKWEGWIGE